MGELLLRLLKESPESFVELAHGYFVRLLQPEIKTSLTHMLKPVLQKIRRLHLF